MVMLQVATPTGVFVCFLDGTSAQEVGHTLLEKGDEVNESNKSSLIVPPSGLIVPDVRVNAPGITDGPQS